LPPVSKSVQAATSHEPPKDQAAAAADSPTAPVGAASVSGGGAGVGGRDMAAETAIASFGVLPNALGKKLSRMHSETENSDFETMIALGKKYGMSVDDVKRRRDEFTKLDLDNNGELNKYEFEQVVRELCGIPEYGHVPHHLMHNFWASADRNRSGALDFEEYLAWSMTHEYSEEMLVADEGERHMRGIARKHGFYLPDVERVKSVFDSFDTDRTGNMEEEEFREALLKLMRVKNPADVSQKKLQRFWREVDTDGSGLICFEEFVLWYLKFFNG